MTALVKHRSIRISYAIRAFLVYILILGALVWFTLDNAIERLTDSMRQGAESVMVDFANLVAEIVQTELDPADQRLNVGDLDSLFDRLAERKFEAQIYSVLKTRVDASVIVTDATGRVIFDSSGQNIGSDYSEWNDIKLTLAGGYGARTSFIDPLQTGQDDPRAMFVAAPVLLNDSIVGAVSIMQPMDTIEAHLVAERSQLLRYVFGLLLIALVIGYFLSLWFTYALGKIAKFANSMAAGNETQAPEFLDQRLEELTNSISNLRTQIDGKQYVENYIYSLTHELKSPLTSVAAAAELLQGDMPEPDRQRFVRNIQTSNQRMSLLVDRLLSLAKLEGRRDQIEPAEFDLYSSIKRLIEERRPQADQRELSFQIEGEPPFVVSGDRILLTQAVANLLDNALRFAEDASAIQIRFSKHSLAGKAMAQLEVINQGTAIPDFAHDRIFERFFSLPNTDSDLDSRKSTGLGLTFVLQIMKLHRGQVTVENHANGVRAVLIWPS